MKMCILYHGAEPLSNGDLTQIGNFDIYRLKSVRLTVSLSHYIPTKKLLRTNPKEFLFLIFYQSADTWKLWLPAHSGGGKR